MARRPSAVNGVHANGSVPPPSTIAAQIVHNQTRPPGALQQDGQLATFADLLNEILHNHAAAPETDIGVNVKLISVVTEAGLAPLTESNPFAQWDALLQQGSDSLKVIDATLRRQPEILFRPISPDGPPLVLPLLAKLFAICGRKKCGQLPVADLISEILSGLDSSINFWQSAHLLRQVIRESMDDIILSLDDGASPVSISSPSIAVPPARSIAKLWVQSEQAIALPRGCQFVPSDWCHAVFLAMNVAQIEGLPAQWRREVQTKLSRVLLKTRSSLEAEQRWAAAVAWALAVPGNVCFLNYMMQDMITSAPEAHIQVSLAKALVLAVDQDFCDVKDDLSQSLLQMANSDSFDRLHEDLRYVIATTLCRLQDDCDLPDRVQTIRATLQQGNMMLDGELQSSIKRLSATRKHTRPTGRRVKRQRLAPENASTYSTGALERLSQLMGVDDEVQSIGEVCARLYSNLAVTEQCVVWQTLVELSASETDLAADIVTRLIDLPVVQESQKPRILSMLALHACANRSTDPGFLNVSTSRFGQVCLRSLHSSMREMRLAAGQCLPAFVRHDLPQELKIHNRKVVLEYLRVLSERNVLSEQETLIGAWGSIALACDDSELNLALLRLVDYLGHSNPLMCSLAYSELEHLSVSRGQSVEDMFKPFWTSIAVSVVQDLHRKPQKAQQLCDLLGFQVNQLLVMTQQETIPSLVLTKKIDVLQSIAAARGQNTSIQDLCLQPRTNLASILALLLLQAGSDAEAAATVCLTAVAPGFHGTDIASLVKIDAILTGCEVLKHIGDVSDSQKSHAYRAFHIFASIAERRPGQAKSNAKASRMVAEFFDTHRLGILAHFSDVLESAQGIYSTSEKSRCVKAIAEMIKINKGQVSAALPQIRAALQSAMDQPLLCDVAFEAWLDLLSVLDGDAISHIVDQSFALILRHWLQLSTDMQHTVHKAVGILISNHNQTIRDNIMTVPSLSSIPLLSKFGAEIERLKSNESAESLCRSFAKRLRDESWTVVLRALEESIPFLEKQQEYIHEAAVSEQPPTALSDLLRALLDVTSRYSAEHSEAAGLSGKALGIIGCLDPNRIEVHRKKRRIMVLSNFERANEVVDWALVLLEDVLVKAFRSATNARAQGYLAYTMQELLSFCGLNEDTVLRPRSSQAPSVHHKWMMMPEHVRIILTPFVTSRYIVTSNAPINPPERKYPGFSVDSGYASWLRGLGYDLMWKAKGDNPQMVFPLLARIMRMHDITIPSFVLPYAILNVVLGGTVSEVNGIASELLIILTSKPESDAQLETIKLCSESVFTVLDYMSTWLQEKKSKQGDNRAIGSRSGNATGDFDQIKDTAQIDIVERFLSSIPAEAVATQAVMCGSYARALFHWEKYIRQRRPLIPSAKPFQESSTDAALYDKLLDIYSQIEEPDGLEGLSAHLPILSNEQEAIQHAKAGRWTAAQAWYESRTTGIAPQLHLQEKLLDCLHETGRYAPLVRYADSFISGAKSRGLASSLTARFLPSIVEAQWMSLDLASMKESLSTATSLPLTDFNTGVASIITAYSNGEMWKVADMIGTLRNNVSESMTVSRTSSVQICHDDLKKLHTLYEIEALSHVQDSKAEEVIATLDRRLAIVGSYVSDKQYVLGVRRAVMCASPAFDHLDVGTSWLATAKLARQSGNTELAYSAVLSALDCGHHGAKLEEARLLWREGHQRHAIHALESALNSEAFELSHDDGARMTGTHKSSDQSQKQNTLHAKALLLFAKWLDASGQSQTKEITDKYQKAAKSFQRWEKGHYYLGKHYQKLLEAEKALPKDKQSPQCLGGEMTRVVIDNFLRSIPFGNKYWHQVIPKVLTLWLDLGMQTLKPQPREDPLLFEKRVKSLSSCNRQMQKYFDRVSPYVFYSAMPQMISRITHPNPDVWKQLLNILSKVASSHPSQSLWSFFALIKATDRVRAERGMEILTRVRDPNRRQNYTDSASLDLRVMIQQGQKLTDSLLQACEAHVEPRLSSVSLSRDLGFNLKLVPNPLVVPIETTLTVNLPSGANTESIRRHKAFVQDKITIDSFSDDVLVLSSLQRPRKLTVRGSDGKQYGLLCKPRDDLRKDQRLMEFNGFINRALKRDAEISKRRLYIKTYAVTPLSEESGIIEWVERIKPIRDILLQHYLRRGIRPNYNDLKNQLTEASADPSQSYLFVEKILPKFPPVMHEWFTEICPEPDAWFAARLRYARSAAVMSIVGYVLGLGDRHGENILLEQSTGGIFHVDFNCLFDKGLTFEKPELVPFRLTHNMVNAMGPYGYDGPFRKSSELTLRLLRQSKDTLMTILETFLYDPTTDFVGKKKRTTEGVPETPQEILDNVERKLKGLLRGETVPLSVDGHVDALVREATSPFCLASMYIGWCPFL